MKIALAGTGNVAWHLGKALSRKGITITQVLGRTAASALQLANELKVKDYGEPRDMDPEAEVCLICVSDEAIPSVLEKLKPGKCLCIHTAGSVTMDIFDGFARNYGVLYPVQTLTKYHPVNYRIMPLLIEANSPENLRSVGWIADQISGRVLQADSHQRLYLHLAAMFAGNFTNHMLTLAEKIIRDHGLSFELLKPLIKETTAKATTIPPRSAQTGPASRGNTKIIEKHLALLQELPDLQELYRMISESIMRERGGKRSREYGVGSKE